MLCPRCSGRLIEAQPTCPKCGWARPVRDPSAEPEPPTAHWLTPDEVGPVNTSGTDLPPPQEVREMGYCWGGYAMPFYFSWANNIGLGCLFNGLLMSLWLGRHGHEAAWKNRHFRSLREFQDTMRAWNRWGKVHVALSVGFLLLMLLFVLSSFAVFGRGSDKPATEADLDQAACLENMRQIAHACLIYSYDYDDRLPLAENRRPALTPLLPYDKLPQCPQKTAYAFNRNVSGRRLPDLPRFVGLIFEADEQGHIAYVHPASCGGSDANVACSDGEAFGECSKHPGRVDWAGTPPPGLASKTDNGDRQSTIDNSR